MSHTVASPPNQTTAEELEKVNAILARVGPEFDNPHFDPNLAELCRSALRGNREHLAWVLEASDAS